MLIAASSSAHIFDEPLIALMELFPQQLVLLERLGQLVLCLLQPAFESLVFELELIAVDLMSNWLRRLRLIGKLDRRVIRDRFVALHSLVERGGYRNYTSYAS